MTHLPSSPRRDPEVAVSPPAAARTSSSACRASSRAALAAPSMVLAACRWLQSTGRGHEKCFPPQVPPPIPLTAVFSDSGLDPLGRHNVTHTLMSLLRLPRVEEHQAGGSAACSNWPSLGQTLTPKYTKHHPQWQPSTALYCSETSSAATSSPAPGLAKRLGQLCPGGEMRTPKKGPSGHSAGFQSPSPLSRPTAAGTHLSARLRASWASIEN